LGRPKKHETPVPAPVHTEEAELAASEAERIRALPKEVGFLLIIVGIGGLLLPGPVGTPFVIVGGVVLWPKAFGRVESMLERRFPRVHRSGMRQIARFVHDLEARYPYPK
jgi:hypothetical protein